jgi:quercetin dioxygenase-like cupin family protein
MSGRLAEDNPITGLARLDLQARHRQALLLLYRTEAIMSASGPGMVLQPDEGESYWQPVWANGYSTIKIGPKDGVENLSMGVQVIAPGGYVREHSHTPNEEILFCFAGRGTIIVDGVPHPLVPGTTVYAGPGVKHKIINDGPDELKMTWTYLPPGLNDFFAAIGRPRRPGEPAPEPFARPADVHAIEARTGYGPPIEG